MRISNRLRGLSRGTVVNLVIAAALALVVLMTVRVVTADGADDTAAAQTASADVGDVTATVSASGNVDAESTVDLSFEGSGGIVEAIYVTEGQQVRKGQRLAVVDRTSALQGLRSARATLRSARAGYLTTTQGQTSQEQAVDASSVDVAEESVESAQVGLRSAEQSLRLTRTQNDQAVNRAEQDLDAAVAARDRALAAYQADPGPDARTALQTARTAVDTARAALQTARSNRASAVLSAQQQVASARQSLESANAQLRSTRAQVAVNRQPARTGSVESALAQVDSAQVAVDEAEETLAQTVLRAPSDGTVVAINGAVGSTSTSTGSSSSSSSSSSTSDSSTSSSSSSSGFITMTGADVLEVTAYVAEADIADVRVGQQATVTLSASDREVGAEVVAIDTVETITNNVVEYGVTVRLDRTKGIKLGQTSQIEITTGSQQGVLRVPSSALTTIGDRTTATVREEDGTTSDVVVQTGLEGDGETEVLSGLEEGDTLVLPDQSSGTSGFTFPAGGIGSGLGGAP